MSFKNIVDTVAKLAKPDISAKTKRFFKSEEGQYGYGDVFAGITNPTARSIAKQNKHIPMKQIPLLLQSKIHEQRFIGLVIMTEKFKIKEQRQQIYKMYMNNINGINNWDLVDLSAPHIVGEYLYQTGQDRSVLYRLSESKILWERRISILSTMTFVKHNQFQDCQNISKKLLNDKEDLIHKAVGWLLRELGKKSTQKLEQFLQANYDQLPRTTLRYSIEKFPQPKRKQYLKGQF